MWLKINFYKALGLPRTPKHAHMSAPVHNYLVMIDEINMNIPYKMGNDGMVLIRIPPCHTQDIKKILFPSDIKMILPIVDFICCLT